LNGLSSGVHAPNTISWPDPTFSESFDRGLLRHVR
jgi:hypothetical protein